MQKNDEIKKFEKVDLRLPLVRLSPGAWNKLLHYTALCDYEISGLGEVELLPHGFLVQDVFLIKQNSGFAYSELSSRHLSQLLISLVKKKNDPSRLKLWWHSHAGMDVFWSPLDDYTARGFQNDFMLSLVMNKRGNYRCRLDLYRPLNLTIDNLPVSIPEEPDQADPELKEALRREIQENVTFYAD